MSAGVARGVCFRGGKDKVRYRSRARARKGLDAARQACAASLTPPELWPAKVFRCTSRIRGGCNGWHLSVDRPVLIAYLADRTVYGEVTDLLIRPAA